MGSKERKAREKDNRRDEIIAVGEKFFFSKGLLATTMDEIARECELAKGTIYLYFKSKEQLYLTIVLRAVTLLFDMISEAQAGITDPPERLAMVGKAHYHFYEKHPGYFMLLYGLFSQVPSRSEDLRDILLQIRAGRNAVWSLMVDIIEEGIVAGIFKKGTDSSAIALGLFSVSTMMMVMMEEQVPAENSGDLELSRWQLHREDIRKKMVNNCDRLVYSILADTVLASEFEKKWLS